MDFGWEHPFAATRNAWDKDNDVWYVCASYREKQGDAADPRRGRQAVGRLDTVRVAA